MIVVSDDFQLHLDRIDTNLGDHTERSLHECSEETEIIQREETETLDPSEASSYLNCS